MWRYMYLKIIVILAVLLAWGFSACQCNPPVRPDGLISSDSGIVLDGPRRGEGVIVAPDGRVIRPDGKTPVDEDQGCPPSWTVKMEAKDGAPTLSAVFCPAPTIAGCQSLQSGFQCEAADTPLIQFLHQPGSNVYQVVHSGSIEQSSHGEVKAAADATQPDRIEKLPAGVKITAMISGVPTSFQFNGTEVTVFSTD